MSKSITARRLTAATLTVGALTAALAVPATAADHDHDRRAQRPNVEISDVQYDSRGDVSSDSRRIRGQRWWGWGRQMVKMRSAWSCWVCSSQ